MKSRVAGRYVVVLFSIAAGSDKGDSKRDEIYGLHLGAPSLRVRCCLSTVTVVLDAKLCPTAFLKVPNGVLVQGVLQMFSVPCCFVTSAPSFCSKHEYEVAKFFVTVCDLTLPFLFDEATDIYFCHYLRRLSRMSFWRTFVMHCRTYLLSDFETLVDRASSFHRTNKTLSTKRIVTAQGPVLPDRLFHPTMAAQRGCHSYVTHARFIPTLLSHKFNPPLFPTAFLSNRSGVRVISIGVLQR